LQLLLKHMMVNITWEQTQLWQLVGLKSSFWICVSVFVLCVHVYECVDIHLRL